MQWLRKRIESHWKAENEIKNWVKAKRREMCDAAAHILLVDSIRSLRMSFLLSLTDLLYFYFSFTIFALLWEWCV